MPFRCVLQSPSFTALEQCYFLGPDICDELACAEERHERSLCSMQEPLVGDRLSANEALGILEGKGPRPAGSRWDFSPCVLISHPAYPQSPDM